MTTKVTSSMIGGVSRSCLLCKQYKQTTFQMHTIIPLTYPGFFGSIFASVAKKIHAMASSIVSQKMESDYRATFTTIWKRHIQRMDGVADIKLFWYHPISHEHSLKPLNENCSPSQHLENCMESPQSSTKSPQRGNFQTRNNDERQYSSFMPNKAGVVKRRKRALHKLSLRISQREYIDSSLSIHQNEEMEQTSKKQSVSSQKDPSFHSLDWTLNDNQIDNNFVPLYHKMIKYWFSLLGEHFHIDSEESQWLQYPFISSACDELYQSLAKTYHQIATQISTMGK
ncbi:hypothetical protein Gasu2_04290 [Galdieria sulphuraria]|nr:hypothetical protein Gasu2_04290 [Galdieria sulphuraria]